MINEKEIEAVTLSATKKDFYQIWNELLDTARKLSNRWDPTSTNESDPGIVLLKVLTAIADKTAYTIDKNTLEAFMPSAAQEESMRKLCDMMGYSMKYYQSATTDVTISYIGEDTISSYLSNGIPLPKFTNIKNADEDVNYFTIEDKIINDTTNKTITVECMEGEFVLCADDTDNVVSLSQLDDNNRYYLPESQIAENGIFIYNIADSDVSERWDKVDNLNTQIVGKKCFKFGFDSRLAMPYVQFPDDISSIIQDGLVIGYTRTNGVNGNISYNTLSKLEEPSDWSSEEYSSASEILISENFAVKNAYAAMNGKDKESIDDAYNNYKKTIGTFDTLVTCRDYINKIYQMTTDDANTTPLVSNINVADIRDDINKAINLCTFNEYGIAYVDKSLKDSITSANKINHFDLVLYPFTTITGSATKQAYKNSFVYSEANLSAIKSQLEDYKTISHNIVTPDANEIVAIKNYLRIKAVITTTAKVNSTEEALIKSNIYSAIYENFNARKVDFGESLVDDVILDVIKEADSRIKNVSLMDPVLYSKACLANGTEYDLASSATDSKRKLNFFALRNIIAGRISLFDYETSFKHGYGEQKYSGYDTVYTRKPAGAEQYYIGKVESNFNVSSLGSLSPTGTTITLQENEVIQFRAPNIKTITTYPAYVNYLLHLSGDTGSIDANSDYKLGTGEWLAINYTPSVTNEDGSTSTVNPVNVVYEAGTIIRPNFKIYDSVYWKGQGHTAPKTSGFDFTGHTDILRVIGITNGMYTLNTNEQIEYRDRVEVRLDDLLTNIYWERNDEKTLTQDDTTIWWSWDEDPATSGGTDYTAYTLKEGEYFYYTDASKIDLAYYGNGTKIIKGTNTPPLYKEKRNATEISEKIASDGLAAALPWVPYNLSGTNKAITLQEFQYINLAEGDTLKSITPVTGGTLTSLSKAWSADHASAATYRLKDASSDSVLPTINLGTWEGWSARSILNINIGPKTVQTLHNGANTTNSFKLIYYNISDDQHASGQDVDIIPTGSPTTVPVALEANYIYQSSAGEIDTHIYKYDDNGGITAHVNDFSLKTFNSVAVQGIRRTGGTLSDIDLNTFGDGHWSKVSFKDYTQFTLNANLQTNTHGIIMFYYIDTSTTITNNAYITLSGEGGPAVKICNADDGTATGTLFGSGTYWWLGGKVGTGPFNYCLRPGINIVEIPLSCTITVHAGTNTNASVIFSDLDLVKYESSNLKINPYIDYKVTSQATAIAQALYDIAQIDTNYDFYYNAVICNSTAIDLNTEAGEKLSDPEALYDYNNINNKFVISEIDADYLPTGITISNSSKR